MAKNVGYFIDKGDDSELYHPLRSRPDKRTDLEYFIETKGQLPRKENLGLCDLCKHLNQEVCNSCTGWHLSFTIISLKEAERRLLKEKELKAKKNE